jgi:hypothetical protein
MPKIRDYEKYVGPDAERTQMATDAATGKISISIGSEFTVVNGSGTIVDVYIWDGTAWNN